MIQTDRYTKAVLTIIAVALSIIAVKDLIPPARAQADGPVHVIVDQWGSYIATLPLPVHEQ